MKSTDVGKIRKEVLLSFEFFIADKSVDMYIKSAL